MPTACRSSWSGRVGRVGRAAGFGLVWLGVSGRSGWLGLVCWSGRRVGRVGSGEALGWQGRVGRAGRVGGAIRFGWVGRVGWVVGSDVLVRSSGGAGLVGSGRAGVVWGGSVGGSGLLGWQGRVGRVGKVGGSGWVERCGLVGLVGWILGLGRVRSGQVWWGEVRCLIRPRWSLNPKTALSLFV